MRKAAPEAPTETPFISLELAKLFIHLARIGTIAGASRALDMDSSLATRKLAQLEAAFGARLVERTTRSLSLTEAGRVALAWATSAATAFENASDEVASLQTRPSGLVRLAVAQYTALEYLPRLLAEFCANYPHVRLTLSTTDSLVNLIEGGYDVAIHSGQVPESSLVARRLREFQRILCASRGYVAARGEPERPQDLESHDCLVHSANEPGNWCFRRGKGIVSQPVRARVEADNYAVLLELARQSLGILRVSENLVLDDIRAGRLVKLMPRYRCVYPSGELPGLWLLYPNRHLPYRTRLFVDFMVDSLSRRS
ncbi:MAG TPA: LysR family transcriptional regulator [Usitatibacter sp.]|nr:LysR family transcriptional regulator [Usitatibacter sp.]